MKKISEKKKIKSESRVDYAIVLEDVHKMFKTAHAHTPVIKGVSLKIKPGAFVIITGPSGSGKSTLLNIIAGLETIDKGRVFVKGKEIEKLKQGEKAEFRAKNLGFIYQQPNWLMALNVLENTAFPLIINGESRFRAKRIARHNLKKYNLDKLRKLHPRELSGGEQQRVALIRALIHKPFLVIADEPTGNLDTHNADDLMLYLRKLNQLGHTIVLVTHNTAYSIIATHTLKIKDGRIVNEEIK